MHVLSNEEIRKLLAPEEKICPSCGQKFKSVSTFMPHLAGCNQSMAMEEARKISEARNKELKKKKILQGMKDWATTFFEGNK